MSDTKHSPGPWGTDRHDPDEPGDVGIYDEDGDLIGTAENENGEGWPNAWVMAAAPELLEACQMVLEKFNESSHTDQLLNEMDQVEAAIAKATGKEG